MITNTEIHPSAGIKVSQLEGHGFGIAAKALLNVNEIRYVDSNGEGAADQPSAGKRPDKGAFATVAYAVTQVPKDTLLVVRENHTENIASDAWAWGAEGIKVIGLGTGDERPTFTFITATAAKINLDEANCGIYNLRLINGIASQTAMVLLSDAGIQVIGCFLQQGDATTQAGYGILGSSAYDNAKVIGNEIVTTTDTGATAGISMSGTPNNVEVADNFIYGDFSSACIHNPTGNVLTLLRIHHNVLTNLQAGDHAIELVSACTGVIHHNIVNCSLSAVADPQGIDCGACLCNENYGSDATDQSGVLTPAVDAA